MALQPGEVLCDRYVIVRVLTSGGMGAVYQARDGHLDDTPCAVKEMHEELLGSDDSELIQRKFAEEKALLARLKHSAIPAVRDFFRLNGLCYIVMDYIHGANLEQQLSDALQLTGAPFAPEVLVKDILQVLEALIYLHELDPPVVHRDIKPANLIREFKTGKVMLVDFGLARTVAGSRTQTAVGTLGYSPLEQIQGRSEPRSDLYSLGVTMHHLLTNHEPVPLDVPPLRQADPSQDEGLAAVVDRATAPVPDLRFANAREMHRALEAWLYGRRGPIPELPAEEPPPTPLPVPTPPARSPWPLALGGALAVLLMFWLGSLLLAAPSNPEPSPVSLHQPPPPHSPQPSPVSSQPPPEPAPVALPQPTPNPDRPSPTAPPNPPVRPHPLRTALANRPRPLLTPDYPRAAPRRREPFPALSGSLREVSLPKYALMLDVPVEFPLPERSGPPEHFRLVSRAESGPVSRSLTLVAQRDEPLEDLTADWTEVTEVPDGFGFSASCYRLQRPDEVGFLAVFPGQEPPAPPGVEPRPTRYSLLLTQEGAPVTLETLAPDVELVMGNLSWRQPPPGGRPPRR